MPSPPDAAGPTERDDPSAIDWDELKQRMREAMRAAIRARADEFGLSWNDYLDRLQGREHPRDDGDGPAP
jgi:hypothetical protein